jgi:hypothetical protein
MNLDTFNRQEPSLTTEDEDKRDINDGENYKYCSRMLFLT